MNDDMRLLLTVLLSLWAFQYALAQDPVFMTNVYGRTFESLNGKWNVLVDCYDIGERRHFEKNAKAVGDEDFVEYSFDGAMRLNVPGDWNSQSPELKYYEGVMWYGRNFNVRKSEGQRKFLYFCGVSYRCKVFLNGKFVGEHEGSFTPFQFEVTDLLKDGDNFLCLKVSNVRTKDAIPAMNFDWWNYGGITRDVLLVTTPETYVNEYFVRLDDGNPHKIRVTLGLSGKVERSVKVEIPELELSAEVTTDTNGHAELVMASDKIELWSPGNPKLYRTVISSGDDTVSEDIGFRTLSVDGTRILLNGKPCFMKSISFHEEIPQRMGRAFSESDARMLLGEAAALGANMVRLAHYPQNEYIVRLAERMGIILWEEIPLWQGIDFSNEDTRRKAVAMYREMLFRDRNRCAVCFWGLANETRPSAARNAFLENVLQIARAMDDTRLYVIADDVAKWNDGKGLFEMDDPLTDKVDVVAVNRYMGWYAPWPKAPAECRWNVAAGKPLIISEFGGEALYGVHGEGHRASSWSEDYQANLMRDNIEMFKNIDNLAGISPWILFDFRSPNRLSPGNQDGWNRKGLLSDQGLRKKAWYVIRDFYDGCGYGPDLTD